MADAAALSTPVSHNPAKWNPKPRHWLASELPCAAAKSTRTETKRERERKGPGHGGAERGGAFAPARKKKARLGRLP